MTARAVSQPWHGIVDDAVTDGLHRQQIVDRVLAVFPQLTRPQIDGRISRRRQLQRIADTPDVAGWEAAKTRATAELQSTGEKYDWARIVELPAIERKKLRYTPNPCYIISSDHHWPLHDPRAESIILQAIEALRPRAYILNGDGPDMLAISRYPKDVRRGKSWPMRDEQQHAKNWWRSVYTLTQEWGAALYETQANHSGGSQASRWARYMNENAAALYGLDGFEELVRYERFFHPADVPVQLVDEVVIADDLRVRHGEIVRKDGGYSAKAHREKWGSSVLHGHTHRLGSSMKRRPGIPGVRDDEFLKSYETGCVCRLDADYAPGADWQQGFAIVHVDDASGSYGVELVQIVNGRATSTSLRGTLAA